MSIARIRKGITVIVINGNDRLYEKVIRRELRVRPGELFSKEDLMRSAREIAQTGHFDPENMDIKPEPNPDNGTVDLIFNLQSKNNDQIELSATYPSILCRRRAATRWNFRPVGDRRVSSARCRSNSPTSQ